MTALLSLKKNLTVFINFIRSFGTTGLPVLLYNLSVYYAAVRRVIIQYPLHHCGIALLTFCSFTSRIYAESINTIMRDSHVDVACMLQMRDRKTKDCLGLQDTTYTVSQKTTCA